MAQTRFQEILDLSAREPDKTLRYGEGPQQFAELYLASGEPKVLIVLIHGGCWRNMFDVGHVRPLAEYLANAGFHVLAPEYRRLGDAGGGWPGTFNDIHAAVQLAAAEYPDSTRIVAGHSAGGHLALWVSSKLGGRWSEVDVDAAIGLAAIPDLATYATGSGSCEMSAAELMGGRQAEQEERYSQGSPAEMTRKTPALLIHGEADPIVPLSQSTAFAERHNSAVNVLEGAGHFELINPVDASAMKLFSDALHELLEDSAGE